MSQADIDIVKQSSMIVRQFWLESFSMTQKGMLVTKLQKVEKNVVTGAQILPLQRRFSTSFLCSSTAAAAVGLTPSTTILDR